VDSLAFIAADTEEAQLAAKLVGALWPSHRRGRRHRGAGRRRLHAADHPPAHGQGSAHLRHEPRLHRLPDERICRGRAARAHPDAIAETIRPLEMVATRQDGTSETMLAINEVALFRQSARRPRSASQSTTRCGLEELSATGSWWRRRRAPPPTTCRPTGRSCRSTRRCWRSPRSAPSGRGAGAGRCCPTAPWCGSTCSRRTSGRSTRWPTIPRSSRSCSVTVRETRKATVSLLFDASHSWDERILSEQFRY
jgi:NAD+ kinase